MATDKLINHSQGESIISQLGDIATSLENVTTLSPAKFGMGYAVCDTAAGTAAKTATIANYRATEGALVTVKFTNGNTAANATLNLNSLGAVPILYKGSAIATDIIGVGDTCTFVYSTANSGSYTIINTDTLSGDGAGTVTSVGATGGIITDQTGGAAINSTGSVKLNLKSNTAYTGTVSDPATTDKIYPVALDGDGHPCVGVPWTDTTYTQAANSAITVNNTNHTIDVAVGAVGTKGVVELSTSIPATGAVDTKVATEKAVADSVSDKAIGTSSSTTAAIATFAGTDGKTLADSAVTIAKNATGVTDDDTKVPTSKAVKTYVDATATGISRYIGTITAASQLSTTAKKGDFYIVKTAWTGVHAGDEIIAEKDNPAQTIDGTNWTLLHNEADTNTTYEFAEGTTNGKFTVTPSDTGTAQSVTIHGLAASAYKGVDTTPTASSSNLVESGGVASALSNKQDTLTFDGTYSASTNKAATVSTVTGAINALDVTGTNAFGAGKTISAWGETDGKVSITSQDISITGSQISDIDTSMPSTAVDTKVPSTKLVKTQLSGKQDTLTFDGTYSASTNKAATVSTVTNAINALDVAEVPVGATKTLTSISQTDGKISATATDIQSASTSQKGLVQLNDTLTSTSTTQAATANAVKAVNDKAETNQTNILYTLGRTGRNLYNSEDCVIGKRLDSYGEEFTDSDYQTSGYIPVSNISTLVRNVNFGIMEALCEYDENKTFISRTPDGIGNSVSLNANTKYVRISLATSRTNVLLCSAEDWNVSHEYTPYLGLPNYDLTYLQAEDRAALAEVVDEGAKNIFDFAKAIIPTTQNPTNATYSKNNDSITVNSNGAWGRIIIGTPIALKAGNYVFSCTISNYSKNNGKPMLYLQDNVPIGNAYAYTEVTGNGKYILPFTLPTDHIVYVAYYGNASETSGSTDSYTASENMICTEADWKISQNYESFSLPNYDLTQLEAEDRAALAEVVDEGAKNIFDLHYESDFTSSSKEGLTATLLPDGTISVTGIPTTTEGGRTFIIAQYTASYLRKFNGYYMSGSVAPSGNVTETEVVFELGGSPYTRYAVSTNGNFTSLNFPNTSDLVYFYIRIYCANTTTAVNLTFKPMITTKAKLDISQNYAPPALPNYDLTRMVNDLQKKAIKVYTYHINPNESDPEDAVTYLDDATGLTPAKMGASSFSYGSWANAWFLPKPCMLKSDGTVAYYLDPNDYSKKTDGTASDIADSAFDGNVMLEFPKIWVKRVNDGNGARTVSIAPVNVDGTYKCWSNINAEDKEVDHFYLPAYNGTIHSSKMRSLSGVTLDTTYAPNYTRAQEVTAATANNPTGKNLWYTETWADMCLVYDLLYLMGKSLDVQRTFGQGLSSGAEPAMRAYVTGTHNAKGLFYGDASGTSTAVKVLGMENLWGCRWHAVAGLINDNGTLKAKMTYGVADGSTAVGYNTTGSGYLNYGSTYGTAGYVKKMQADNTMGYKIIETAGTDATYYCNYYYVNNSQSNYALLGGDSGGGASCGFCVSLSLGAASTDWAFGGSLSCKPFALPNTDLLAALAQNGGFIDSTLGSIIANADLNSINKTTFAVYNEPANLPSGITGYCYVRTSVFDENSALQELYVIQPNPVSFFRIKLNNSWTFWTQTSNV